MPDEPIPKPASKSRKPLLAAAIIIAAAGMLSAAAWFITKSRLGEPVVNESTAYFKYLNGGVGGKTVAEEIDDCHRRGGTVFLKGKTVFDGKSMAYCRFPDGGRICNDGTGCTSGFCMASAPESGATRQAGDSVGPGSCLPDTTDFCRGRVENGAYAHPNCLRDTFN